MKCVVLLSLLALAAANPLEPETNDNKRVKRLDDNNPLQTLVEQQASLIQTLQADLTANRNRISSLEDEVKAKTKAVAFSTRIAGSHDSTNNGLSLGQHQIVPFDEVITNVGQAYNAKTGIFTAPVSGTYAFFLSQMTPSSHASLYLAITKNGVILDKVYTESGQTDIGDQASSQVTTHMTSGDQVYVRQDHGDAVRGDYWTIFTGYLLQAD